jgi:hypothetical protein
MRKRPKPASPKRGKGKEAKSDFKVPGPILDSCTAVAGAQRRGKALTEHCVRKPKKMSEDTVSMEIEYDFMSLELECDIDGAGASSAEELPPYMDSGQLGLCVETELIDMEIAKKELEVLNARRALQVRHAQMGGHGSRRMEEVQERDPREYETLQKARRKERQRLQTTDSSARETVGKKRYVVEVDMKGTPCGQN